LLNFWNNKVTPLNRTGEKARAQQMGNACANTALFSASSRNAEGKVRTRGNAREKPKENRAVKNKQQRQPATATLFREKKEC